MTAANSERSASVINIIRYILQGFNPGALQVFFSATQIIFHPHRRLVALCEYQVMTPAIDLDTDSPPGTNTCCRYIEVCITRTEILPILIALGWMTFQRHMCASCSSKKMAIDGTDFCALIQSDQLNRMLFSYAPELYKGKIPRPVRDPMRAALDPIGGASIAQRRL